MTTKTEADTVAAEVVEKQAPSSGTPPAEPTPASAPVTVEELGKQLTEANKEREDLRHKLASFEGSAKGRQRIDERLDRLDKRIGKLGTVFEAYLESGGDIETTKAKQAALSQEERTAQQQQRREGRLERLAGAIGKKAEKLAIKSTHPKAQEIRQKWEDLLANNADVDAFEDLATDFDDFLDSEREKRAQVMTEKAVKQAQAEAAATLEKTKRDLDALPGPLGGAGGAAGGHPKADRDNIDALWVKWERENSGKANPYEGQYREFLATGKV